LHNIDFGLIYIDNTEFGEVGKDGLERVFEEYFG